MSNVVRVWIDVKHNVPPDIGSRLQCESALVAHLLVPNGPLLDFIRKLIISPDELAKEVANKHRESGVGPWHSLSETAPRGYATPTAVFEGPITSAPWQNDDRTTDPAADAEPDEDMMEHLAPESGPSEGSPILTIELDY